jgi:hypothetical protein
MFVETEQFAADLAAMGEGERERACARVREWFADNQDKITHHTHLMPSETATAVRLEGAEPLVTDVPFRGGQGGGQRLGGDRRGRPGRGAAAGQGAAGMSGGGDPAHRLVTRPRHTELARVVGDHASRLAAPLVHLVGDFSAAGDHL